MPIDSDVVKMGALPVSIPGKTDIAECVRDVLLSLNVEERVRAKFAGRRGLDGWFPRVTIVPCVPGQHVWLTVFVDVSVECGPGDDQAISTHSFDMPFCQHWTANFMIDRRYWFLGADKFFRLIELRLTNAINRMRVVGLYSADQVTLEAEDDPAWLHEDVGDFVEVGEKS